VIEVKTGRPKKENAITKLISFKADTSLSERLKAYCKLVNRTQGEVIRAAIEQYITPENEKK
jgi:predicted DNA-binding protein